MEPQYHEPASELSLEVRTLARIFASLKEEIEAINWYTQRLSLETDEDAKKIMAYARDEEFRHAGIDLEFLLRKLPHWKEILKSILFQEDDIVAHADEVPESLEQENLSDEGVMAEPDADQLLREFWADE